ncbi:MAG TPA: hypothetical protein VGC56_17575 [Allosphingosinicella sp.]|jgi:hypothetical protein
MPRAPNDLPYRLHIGHELGMMLRAEKPLAVFSDGYGFFPDAVLRYLRMFDRHVEVGRFFKAEYVEPDNSRGPHLLGWHTIMYALPGEESRIDALIALRLSETCSDAHEREEGRLLGYAEWQCDAYIAVRAAWLADGDELLSLVNG